jgi:NADH-quinone oxidoreductase subunit M
VFNQQGIEGAVITMLSHGVVSGALFLCVGIVYDRLHTRDIARYGGLAKNMPAYALFFMLFTMASVGLPGTSGFVGEFLVFIGAYKAGSWVALVMLTGIILGAAYMLYLYRRVIFGTLEKAELRSLTDLTPREIAIMAPLAAVVLWMGVYPKPFLDPLHAPVAGILARVDRAAPPVQQVAARRVAAPAPAAAHAGAH